MSKPSAPGVLVVAGGATLLSALVSCATGPPKSAFERAFIRYRSQPHQKAMVLAGDVEGEWTFGTGYAWSTPGEAIDKAFEVCHSRKKDLSVPAECRLYAVGNEIVEGNAELEARYGRR